MKFNKNKISVVLGSYNRLNFLNLTIQSIREELTDFDHEIIVVDGGSDDGTLQWLLDQKDIITIVQHNRGEWLNKKIERKSWGYFMNLGFKCAQGKYVCMLSDDCLVVPGAIKNGYNLFEEELKKDKKIGAIVFYWRNWSQEDVYHINYTLDDKLYVNHGMYLNQALNDVDYIDEENFFFYNGDGDLCLKMWQKRYEVIESSNSFIEHYPHANINVRKSNYITYKKDLNNYLKKWEGVFYDQKKENRGGGKHSHYVDLTKTGDKFKNIHESIIKLSPEVLKTKSFCKKIRESFYWKYKSLVKKVSNRVGL